jgi:hypothetical protein
MMVQLGTQMGLHRALSAEDFVKVPLPCMNTQNGSKHGSLAILSHKGNTAYEKKGIVEKH